MPERKDATYYVARVTWGMKMAHRMKEKRKTSSHVKYFCRERHFSETNYRDWKSNGHPFFPFLNIFNSQSSHFHNNTPGTKSSHFEKENLEKEAYGEFILAG